MLGKNFFDRDPQLVAKELLGKVVFHKYENHWLSAMIIETEAYYLEDKASHASLGLTTSRKALFMPAGTIYMYYARGGDSLNISCQGDGNAVLIKSAIIYPDENPIPSLIAVMQENNPLPGGRLRPIPRLCSGQTLLCRALGLKVKEWNQKEFDPHRFFMKDVGFIPEKIIQAPRLGISAGRDEDLPYRFLIAEYLKRSTRGFVPLLKEEKNGSRFSYTNDIHN